MVSFADYMCIHSKCMSNKGKIVVVVVVVVSYWTDIVLSLKGVILALIQCQESYLDYNYCQCLCC